MRKRTKRKYITPLINTIDRAAWLASPLDADVKTKILANLDAAIAMMRKSSQSTDDWGQVMRGINLTESFIKAGTIKDKHKAAQEFVHELQEVVTVVMTRHRDTHSNVLTPSELAAFGELYGVLSDVLESATNGEYLKAKDYLENRIRSIVGVKTFKRGELYSS